MKTSQSLKMIYDLDEALSCIPIPFLVEDFINKYPVKYELVIEMSKFLGSTAFSSAGERNSSREVQLLSMPQSAIETFVIEELGIIGKDLQEFEEPLRDCIGEALSRHKKYMEFFIIDRSTDVDVDREAAEHNYRSWWIHFVYQFSLRLCMFNTRQFDTFSLKVQMSKERTSHGVKLTAVLIDAIENHNTLKAMKSGLNPNPLKDRIMTSLRIIHRLLKEHQILTEYHFCLTVDENFTYEDFLVGTIPINNVDYQKARMSFHPSFKENRLPQLWKALVDKGYIEGSEESFKIAFSGIGIPDNFKKILWKKSEPLFCCLIYGHDCQFKDGMMVSIPGLAQKENGQNQYKKALNLFSFRTKTNNITLSSTYQKLGNVNGLRLLQDLLERKLFT